MMKDQEGIRAVYTTMQLRSQVVPSSPPTTTTITTSSSSYCTPPATASASAAFLCCMHTPANLLLHQGSPSDNPGVARCSYCSRLVRLTWIVVPRRDSPSPTLGRCKAVLVWETLLPHRIHFLLSSIGSHEWGQPSKTQETTQASGLARSRQPCHVLVLLCWCFSAGAALLVLLCLCCSAGANTRCRSCATDQACLCTGAARRSRGKGLSWFTSEARAVHSHSIAHAHLLFCSSLYDPVGPSHGSLRGIPMPMSTLLTACNGRTARGWASSSRSGPTTFPGCWSDRAGERVESRSDRKDETARATGQRPMSDVQMNYHGATVWPRPASARSGPWPITAPVPAAAQATLSLPRRIGAVRGQL